MKYIFNGGNNPIILFILRSILGIRLDPIIENLPKAKGIKGDKGIKGNKGIKKTDKPIFYYNPYGCRGYYGCNFNDEIHNKKLRKADKLVDEYNAKINTFKSEEEAFNFNKSFNEKINQLLK